jgi:2,3-dihydroxybenzoate-AMP ligase/mycobactin salicyl-AMP ligase
LSEGVKLINKKSKGDEMKFLKGFTPYKKEDAEKYNRLRWWAGLTFGDVLDKAADIHPRQEALVDSKSRLTYSQVREMANRLAISLMELGVKATDRVLIQLPNWNEFVYSYFGLQKIGAIPVLLIDRYRQYEINHLFRLTGATCWIVPERYRKIDYLPIINDVLRNSPKIKHVILVRGKKHRGLLNLEKLIDRAGVTGKNLNGLAKRRPDPMQVAHMGPTGGTTGLPKVVPRTHNDYLCRVEYAARAWELTNNDIMLLTAPIGHDLSFSLGLCTALFTFGKVVMLDSTEPEDICRTIEREKVTAVAWTPTFVSRLINFGGLGKYDLSSLTKMYCGGGASPAQLVRDASKKLRCVYVNAYGGTEGMKAQTRLDDDIELACRSVGKPTCPYDTYKIVDQNGKELPRNTQGELVIKGPGIFTGYYNAPEENKKAFDKDGFFKTGDLAVIDDSGNITLTGRIREMINRGGESISAVEIENLIAAHPDVAAVAVIGMPDPVMGEKVCAYIQSKPGAKIDFEGVISFLKSKRASVLQLPERIEFVNTLPLTKSKKVDKKVLVEDIKKKISCSA